MNLNTAITSYTQVGNHSAVEEASPHKLILMLLTGAQDRLAAAKGYMERGAIADKGSSISTAMNIINGLRASLDHDTGGEISANLDSLYDYMGRRLFEANLKNDPDAITEVSGLLREITTAWVGIKGQVSN
jgi:flagellar secretion chaperone FliS